jgi:hypothetical protein
MPSRLAELLADPNAAFEAAAARTAEGVRPRGGRKEGPATSALVNALSAVMHSTDPLFAASQERVMGGDYDAGPMVQQLAGLTGGGLMRGAMRGTVGAFGGAPISGQVLPPEASTVLSGISAQQRAKLGPMLEQLEKLGATPEQLRTMSPVDAYHFTKDRQGGATPAALVQALEPPK